MPQNSRASLSRGGRVALYGVVTAVASIGCEPIEDRVFSSGASELATQNARVSETSGLITLLVRLSRPVDRPLSATVVASVGEARDDCFHPDFQVQDSTIAWTPGEAVANYELRIIDDDVAEIDEMFSLQLVDPVGGELLGDTTIEVVIEDDDRSELIDAEARFSLIPGAEDDQSAALQEALDAAAGAGRGVVVLTPGEYQITSASITPGTSLVGYGATLYRPPSAGATVFTLRVAHDGASDSAMTLVEGLTLDGRRDEQGPFDDFELENAHLLFIGGGSAQPGRVRAAVQALTVQNGTGDGLALGPNADVVACAIGAHDVFREGVSVHGGNTRFRLRGLEATATFATTGVWLDGDIPGYGNSRTTDIEFEDVVLESGDLEVEIAQGSRLEIRNLTMGAAPFRLSSRNSTVRISDSSLQVGVPSDRHNHWASPDDVEVVDSTIVFSETTGDPDAVLEEMDREWAGILVRWPAAAAAQAPGDSEAEDEETAVSRLTFDSCRFEIGEDVEAGDHISVVESPEEGGQVVIRNSELANCACDWFAATCGGCQLDP